MTHSILILTNRAPFPLHDGGALAMDAMIRGYADAGCKVGLLMMNTSRHHVGEAVLKERYSFLQRLRIVPVDNELRIAAVLKNLVFSSEPEHVVRFRNDTYRAAMIEMINTMQPDVIQLESPFLGSYLPDIRMARPSTLVVYRMHNVEAQIWSRLAESVAQPKAWYLKVLARRIARFEKALWKQADLLLPITHIDEDHLRAEGIETPTVVAPVAFKSAKPTLPWPQGPLKLYHLGAMDWLPNQEAMRWFLSDVWPLLRAEFKDLEFHFAGRNTPPEFFQNLPAGAFCAAAVPDSDEFIRDKHILAVPLQSGGGLRIKILEAMALGRVVISSDVGIQGLEAEPGKHYLKANSPQDWLDALRILYPVDFSQTRRGAEALNIQQAQYKESTFAKASADEGAMTERGHSQGREIADQGREWLTGNFDEGTIMREVLNKIQSLIVDH